MLFQWLVPAKSFLAVKQISTFTSRQTGICKLLQKIFLYNTFPATKHRKKILKLFLQEIK